MIKAVLILVVVCYVISQVESQDDFTGRPTGRPGRPTRPPKRPKRVTTAVPQDDGNDVKPTNKPKPPKKKPKRGKGMVKQIRELSKTVARMKKHMQITDFAVKETLAHMNVTTQNELMKNTKKTEKKMDQMKKSLMDKMADLMTEVENLKGQTRR